jgi:hypothetical protein
MLPLLACAVVLLVTWTAMQARQSHQTIEAYTRSLQETARRGSLSTGDPAQSQRSSTR